MSSYCADAAACLYCSGLQPFNTWNPSLNLSFKQQTGGRKLKERKKSQNCLQPKTKLENNPQSMFYLLLVQDIMTQNSAEAFKFLRIWPDVHPQKKKIRKKKRFKKEKTPFSLVFLCSMPAGK